MNLKTAIEIYGGGPGSGCNPDAGTCGRPTNISTNDIVDERAIERKGVLSGRWIKYNLIVDGTNLGEVEKTIVGGGDRLRPHTRYVGWRIKGFVAETQQQAEKTLIERSIRFGYLKK